MVKKRGQKEAERVPPQAPEIEAQILGSILIDPEAISKVVPILDADAFYHPAYRKIFEAMVSLHEKSSPVDSITLAEELKGRGQLGEIGGESKLVELSMCVTITANIETHSKIVLEKSLLRSLHEKAATVAERTFDPAEDVFDLLDETEQALFEITGRTIKKGYQTLHGAVQTTLEEMEAIHGTGNGLTGVPIGFRGLEHLTGGWQRSDLIILAGRPSSGKTAFALTVALNAALHKDKPTPVGVFSLEMSARQLVTRLLCADARVDAHKLRTGALPEKEWLKLSLSAARLAPVKILIDDTAGLSILELRAKARRMKVEQGVGLIIIDYLQLVQGPKDSDGRQQEIASISRSLKVLAKDLDLPVMALAQLSRAVESRNDKRPILSDLRESGAIEQDADVVAFVHRPEMYEKPDTDEWRESHGIAEIIVGKQRNGPTDDVKLSFVNEWARFEELEIVRVSPEKQEQPF